MTEAPTTRRIGVVAIGRNEGERLRACLESVIRRADRVIYVDSGSTDDSVSMARSLGVEVVALDLARPFTAARARNAGFARLRECLPDVHYVQFVDGDCEVRPSWLEQAAAFLDSRPQYAVVCGRRRERYPEHSPYNRLCDMEWDTPVGEARYCGGDAMMRADALQAVGGYRESLIAGEEPELCVRLRAVGWKIWRLDAEMTLHDAALSRFGQWWQRTKRGGYAAAEAEHLHGAPPERHGVRQAWSARLWGIGLPLLAIAPLPWTGPASLAILLAYPLQTVRLALRGHRSARDNWLQAGFLVLGKFPEAAGQLKFLYNRLSGKTAHLIEYK